MRFLSNKGFQSLVTGLIKKYDVYGTVEKDGFPAFSRITSCKELELFKTPTHLSAKEFLFPPRETLLKFNIGKKEHTPIIESPEQVLIGLHPCDISGIALMDRVFANGTPDTNYLKRREKTIIIGADCWPDNYCFCKSLDTDRVESGFDLFLHRIKKGFLIRTGSEKGGKILSTVPTAAAKKAELDEYSRMIEERDNAFTAKLDAPDFELPSIYEKGDNSPVWERLGAICTGCGSCNNVCPTCYCFDVKDDIRLNLNEGERYRVWDGCMLEDFAKVAGGHNFRSSRAARLKHRFNRKFRYLTGKYDSLFCTGCGRCSRACLVKINITEVTNELIREQKGYGKNSG